MPQIAVSIGNVRTPSITEDLSNLYCNGEDVIFNGSGLLVGDSYELRLNGTTIASGSIIAFCKFYNYQYIKYC